MGSGTPAWDAVRREREQTEAVVVTIHDVGQDERPAYVRVTVSPVIKFNNTCALAPCLLCETTVDLEIGAQIFNEGTFEWICDDCLERRPEAEMRVWRNRIHGWPDDFRLEAAEVD